MALILFAYTVFLSSPLTILWSLSSFFLTSTDIPEEISKLINMQRLILAQNLIEHLPRNVGKLQSLKLINLDQNRVSLLPDECNNTESCLLYYPSHEKFNIYIYISF